MQLYVDDIMRTGHKYKNNPLWDFFLTKRHRLINKWIHYFGIYDRWFRPFRGEDVVMLEIGIDKGGSLQMWKDYFGSQATIIGVDIEESCRNLAEEQIVVEIGSQEDESFWAYIRQKYPRIDILLDDGGHTMRQQKVTFDQMFPHLSDGGLYMCEDTHSSYMSHFGGNKPDTFVNYMKSIIDDMYAFYRECPLDINENTLNIGGIHFYDSIVVLEKEERLMPPFSLQMVTQGNKNVSIPWEESFWVLKTEQIKTKQGKDSAK